MERPGAITYKFGAFALYPERRLLLRRGRPVALTPKAFDTLLVLIDHRSQLVTKQELMEAIWPDTIVEENNLTQVISALRKALGCDAAGRSYIETAPRRGYRFTGAVRCEPDGDSGPTELRNAVGRAFIKAPWALWLVGGLVAFLGFLLVVEPRGWLSELTHGRRGREAISGTTIRQREQYVVVLPFEVESNQDSLAYLSEGLAEALAARLDGLPGIRASSIGEVAGLIGTRSVSDVGRELGANLVIRGSMRGVAGKMQLNIAAYDPGTGQEVWKAVFPAQAVRIFGVEDEIFSGVEAYLERRGLTSHSLPWTHPTQDVDAYDLYLKGREALRYGQAAEGLKASVRLFQRAVDKDRQFALAYAGLAEASRQVYYQTTDSLWLAKALNAAQQAEQLNGNLAEAHAALGSVYTAYGRGQDAVRELQRSLEMAPDSDESYRWLGHAYLAKGRTQEALAAYERAVALDPYYWLNFNVLGVACFQTGDNTRAVNAFRRVIELEPAKVDGYENLASVDLRLGNWDESIRYYEQALKIRPDFGIYSNLGTAYFYLKRYAEAVGMFEKAAAMNPHDETVEGNLADAYRWSGRREQARATYHKAIAMAYRQLQVNSADAATTGHLALYYAKVGNVQQGLVLIHRARALDHSNVRLIYDEAAIQSLAGNAEAALSCLRQAFEKGYPPTEAKADPELNGIQGRPDFEQLVAAFSAKKS